MGFRKLTNMGAEPAPREATMSDTNQTTPGERALTAYVDGMAARGELLPGAKDYLLRRFAVSNDVGGLAALVNWLATDEAARYRNPEAPARTEAPLRTHLRRFAPVLHDKSPDELFDRLAIHIDPAELERAPGETVQGLWERLQGFDCHEHFLPKFKPALDHRTATVLAVLEDMQHLLSPREQLRLETLAHRWRDIGNNPRGEIARIVARRLSLPQNAALTATGQPIEITHDEYAGAGRRDPDPAHASLVEQFVKMGGYEQL